MWAKKAQETSEHFFFFLRMAARKQLQLFPSVIHAADRLLAFPSEWFPQKPQGSQGILAQNACVKLLR